MAGVGAGLRPASRRTRVARVLWCLALSGIFGSGFVASSRAQVESDVDAMNFVTCAVNVTEGSATTSMTIIQEYQLTDDVERTRREALKSVRDIAPSFPVDELIQTYDGATEAQYALLRPDGVAAIVDLTNMGGAWVVQSYSVCGG